MTVHSAFAGTSKRHHSRKSKHSSHQKNSFEGPSGKQAVEKIVREVVLEHFMNAGVEVTPSDSSPMNERISQNLKRAEVRVQYLMELMDRESDFSPQIEHNDTDGKGGRQTVYGWFQFLPDTYLRMARDYSARASQINIKVPDWFTRDCLTNNEKNHQGLYNLKCQTWVVNFARGATPEDDFGKTIAIYNGKDRLSEWGPVSRDGKKILNVAQSRAAKISVDQIEDNFEEALLTLNVNQRNTNDQSVSDQKGFKTIPETNFPDAIPPIYSPEVGTSSK